MKLSELIEELKLHLAGKGDLKVILETPRQDTLLGVVIEVPVMFTFVSGDSCYISGLPF